MEIVKATWENRNLGVDAYEFKVSKTDLEDMTSVITQITSSKYDNAYLTLKMPVGNLTALHLIEDVGFRFMEMQLHMTKSLVNYEPPKLIAHLKNELVQKEIEKNESSWKTVVKLMTDDTFYTDRIYLDPKLTAGTSRIRYNNWILDLVTNPEAHLFLYYNGDTAIGFGLVKMNTATKVVNIILEGIFENHQKAGFGLMMLDLALRNYQKKGMTKLDKSVSSNNPAIMNLDHLFGYSLCNQEYVLRKFTVSVKP